MRILAVTLSLLAATGSCELLARVFLREGLSDRVEIQDLAGGQRADCYPSSRGIKMTYDLRDIKDALAFVKRFRQMAIGWPGSPASTREEAPLPPTESLADALQKLRVSAPICMLYDTRDESPRFLDEPRGFRASVALLGDSFTFGQGVADGDVLPARLAAKLHARVRSYAMPGANISEIVEQFAHAMRDQAKYHFRRIVYVYVPNDPLLTPELRDRMNLLNDLMNVRLSSAPYSSRFEVRLLGRLAPHSALAATILRTYSARVVARRTLRLYEDVHDAAKNVGFATTFDQIRQMHDQARAAGVDFVVAAYPLMLDMRDYPIESVNRHLAEQAKRVGVDILDLLPAFRPHAGESLTVHPIDLHPNAAAATIAADAIANFLAVREGRVGQ